MILLDIRTFSAIENFILRTGVLGDVCLTSIPPLSHMGKRGYGPLIRFKIEPLDMGTFFTLENLILRTATF